MSAISHKGPTKLVQTTRPLLFACDTHFREKLCSLFSNSEDSQLDGCPQAHPESGSRTALDPNQHTTQGLH